MTFLLSSRLNDYYYYYLVWLVHSGGIKCLQTSCGVTYGARTRPGAYVIAIQVEDFVRRQSPSTALSSVPLQVGVARS